MQLLYKIEDLVLVPAPVYLAIGVFDGVHIGHQAVDQATLLLGRPFALEYLRPSSKLAGPREQAARALLWAKLMLEMERRVENSEHELEGAESNKLPIAQFSELVF